VITGGTSLAFEKVAFVASGAPVAQASEKSLRARYQGVDPEDADVVVALGGDGFMLETLHRFIDHGLPIYGMNRGTVGFLMNEYREDELPARLDEASESVVHPLVMTARSVDGSTIEALAINEVSLLRQTRQASKIRISVDGTVRIDELICDGVLVSTAAGSRSCRLAPICWP